MQKHEDPIIVEETYQCSAETVWQAITDPSQMCQWFFDKITEFRPEVGFETSFLIEIEDRRYMHLWKVVEVIPFKKIAYNWRYEGIAGDSNVSFELAGNGGMTTLRLTHTVLESFPNNVPEFKRESGVAGWTFFIKESLKAYLEGQRA